MFKLLLTALEKIDAVLTRLEKVLICVTLSLMLGVASLQVILRNVFDSGMGWAEVFVRHMVLFLLFFGASLSTRDKRHIQMDVSSKITPKKLKPLLSLFINAFCILVNFYLFKASWIFMLNEKEFQSILLLNIPSWIFISIMPIGFAIITFRFALNWIDSLAVLLKLKKPSPEGHEAMTGI